MEIVLKNFYSKVPSSFTFYDGGLYIGNFFPGPPVTSESSDLLGNKNTGSPITYKTYADGIGDKNNFWGIIVCPFDYEPTVRKAYTQINEKTSLYDTSNYDGLYNKQEVSSFYTMLREDVAFFGYTDWYIPSVDEMAFIAKTIPIGYYIPRRFAAINDDIYRTSSISIKGIYNESNGNIIRKRSTFYYGQSFNKTKYGRVYNIEEHSTNSSIRLIRRINLTKF